MEAKKEKLPDEKLQPTFKKQQVIIIYKHRCYKEMFRNLNKFSMALKHKGLNQQNTSTCFTLSRWVVSLKWDYSCA